MSNNIKLPIGVDPSPFLVAIKAHLNSNLNDYLIKSLSNMLALDYVGRVAKLTEVEVETYSEICSSRLKKHLKHQIITEEDFSTVMSLFTIAITQEKNLDDDTINSKEQEQDLLVEGIIAAHFRDLSPAERQNVKEALRSLINNPDSKEIMNFINTDPKLFYSIVFSAYKEKTKQKEVMESLTMHLAKVMHETKSINKSVDNVKSLAGKITLGAGLFAAASIGLLIGGLALPALLIPAAAVSIRLAPTIGDKIGEGFARSSSKFQQKQTGLKALIASILQPKLEHGETKHLEQKKTVELEVGLEITAPQAGVKRLEASKELAQKAKRER